MKFKNDIHFKLDHIVSQHLVEQGNLVGQLIQDVYGDPYFITGIISTVKLYIKDETGGRQVFIDDVIYAGRALTEGGLSKTFQVYAEDIEPLKARDSYFEMAMASDLSPLLVLSMFNGEKKPWRWKKV
jgi:hypothetical protein